MFNLLGWLLKLAFWFSVALLTVRPVWGLACLLVVVPLALVWWALSVFFER